MGWQVFASRVFNEAEFRQAFLDRFESESSAVVKLTKSEITIEETLQTIELGIAESGVTLASNDVQTSLNTFFLLGSINSILVEGIDYCCHCRCLVDGR